MRLFTLLFVCIAGLMAFTAAGDKDGYKVGDIARDFKLKNIDGEMVSLSDYSDAKGYIVVFTCNHCPYAKMYEQRIIELHNKYADQGYPIVAINPNDPVKQPQDSYENMQKRAKEKDYPFAYLVDETQEIARTYGAAYTPHVFLLKKEGNKNRVAYIGAIDNNYKNAEEADVKYVEAAVDNLLAGEGVQTKQAKGIGCTIKWKDS
ncbi:thioredoxin family protein [Roseivirga sp. BDSF3-8]|uniref:thioredoxin family protein n=1 Tax=Roseivirga sp. BDSF3-8 TaxID=3241598 RepID=UPI003531E628